MGVEEIPNLLLIASKYTATPRSEKSITALMNPKWVRRYSITSSGADYRQLACKCLRIKAETLASNFHHSKPFLTHNSWIISEAF